MMCNRAIKIIKDSISSLCLDLSGYTVLTEVGSNNYIYTPIIPLLAGAKKVYAWTKDSSYGKGDDIAQSCFNIAKSLDLEKKLEFSVNYRDYNHVKNADIITNSRFIRPIDKSFLKFVKPKTVIPLMFEAWEIRSEDIDIDLCDDLGIKVAGTWENHPKIKVFDYVKELTLKMIFEAGFEISGNTFAVWSNDDFGEQAKDALIRNCAKSVELISDYEILKKHFKNVDVLLLFDYHEQNDYFGERGIFNIKELKRLNNSFGVIHLYGNIDCNYLMENNISVFPKKNGKAKLMTYTLAHVGLLPVIRLLTAGLKVGEEILENSISELSQPINF